MTDLASCGATVVALASLAVLARQLRDSRKQPGVPLITLATLPNQIGSPLSAPCAGGIRWTRVSGPAASSD